MRAQLQYPLFSAGALGVPEGRGLFPAPANQDNLANFIAFSELFTPGIAAIGESGRLCGHNGRFGELLKEGDGLRLVAGSISTAARDDAKRLAQSLAAIRFAADEGSMCGTRMLSIRRCGRAALSCAMVPARTIFGADATSACAILFVSDPDACQEDSIRSVCDLYQLTPAETQLVIYLVRGYNSAYIARAMGLKESTIRAYLKHIYTKTDTNQQSALVQLIMASCLPLIVPGDWQLANGPLRRRH
jgi:DNA-binding CsgD family transcriptional regulator